MLDAAGDCLVNRSSQAGFGLVRESDDQVNAEALDACGLHPLKFHTAGGAGVGASYSCTFLIDKALDAEAEAVDGCVLEGLERGVGHLAGGALDCDFRVRGHVEGLANAVEEDVDLGWLEQRRGAAAEVDCVDGSGRLDAERGCVVVGDAHFGQHLLQVAGDTVLREDA